MQLDIYIEPDCINCDQAYYIADLVRRHLPEVQVNIRDLSRPGIPRPENVFAVPTYVLNGRTYSLGNPDAEELLSTLESEV